MQAVDILRHELRDSTAMFEVGQRTMGIVGARMLQALETDEAARPVAFPRPLIGDEPLVGDRLLSLPLAGSIAIVGNARIGAAACSGQHEQVRVAFDELDQRDHSLHRSATGGLTFESLKYVVA